MQQRVPRRPAPAPRRRADNGASWKKFEKMHEVEKQTRRWMSPNKLAFPVLSEGVDGFGALHAVGGPVVSRQQGGGGRREGVDCAWDRNVLSRSIACMARLILFYGTFYVLRCTPTTPALLPSPEGLGLGIIQPWTMAAVW
eukprot:scaffold2979_cov111-Isochrysis_galbana.AAC.4